MNAWIKIDEGLYLYALLKLDRFKSEGIIANFEYLDSFVHEYHRKVGNPKFVHMQYNDMTIQDVLAVMNGTMESHKKALDLPGQIIKLGDQIIAEMKLEVISMG